MYVNSSTSHQDKFFENSPQFRTIAILCLEGETESEFDERVSRYARNTIAEGWKIISITYASSVRAKIFATRA